MKKLLSLRYFSSASTLRVVDGSTITSGLYVPGNQERMLSKCVTSGASLLVPDMEDSVPPAEKPRARALIRQHLPSIIKSGAVVTPRTNGLTTGLFKEDVRGVLDSESAQYIHGFCVPKVDTVEEYREIESFLGAEERRLGLQEGLLKLIPQVESTLSMVSAGDIFKADRAGRKRIIAAAFGADDFTADFEIYRSDNDKELDFVRKWFALNCHAYGITSIDTPYVHYKNLAGLKEELAFLKSIGMKAKFAIHPTQIEVINSALRPSPEEVEYYSRLVAAFERVQAEKGKAACEFEGKMIDIAAYRRAKAIIKRAK